MGLYGSVGRERCSTNRLRAVSLFFFRFSKGCARPRECWAAKPRDARNEGGSLSRLAPSVTRVVICVSRAFCSTDQGKRETAHLVYSANAEAMGLNPVQVPNFFWVNLQLLKLQLPLRRSYLHLNLYFRSSDHLQKQHSNASIYVRKAFFTCTFLSL